jgi:CubicO group peptidase (beta-lactamase class C family)
MSGRVGRPVFGIVLLLSLVGLACPRPSPEPPAQAPLDQVWFGDAARDPDAMSRARDLEHLIRDGMARWAVPGVSVAVADDSDLIWAAAFGSKEAPGGDPLAIDTPLQAASVSKPVASAVVLSLVAEGHLDLDAPVSRWLDPWPLVDPPSEAVTLRRLLSHTAGLGQHGFPGYGPAGPLPTLAQILAGEAPANTDPVRLEAAPGERFAYSGGGYVVVEAVVASVTGRPFAEVARDRVLIPAGMVDSAFGGDGAGAARGHRADGVRIPDGMRRHPELAAAGLWTTAADLVRFAVYLQASLGAAAGDRPAAEGLLSPALARQMMTAVADEAADPDRRPGLGVFLAGEGAGGRFFHGGANRGYRAVWIGTLGTGQAAAVLTNGENGEHLAWEILDAIARAYGWPQPQR